MHLHPVTVTNERVQLDLFIEASAWEGTFDSLEIQRSRSGGLGPYEPLHADTWESAVLPWGNTDSPPVPAQAGRSVVLVGKSIQFLLDEVTKVSVTFTGTDPLTLGQAAAQIQAQSEGELLSFVSAGVLIVQTEEAGVKASLRCTGGDAAPLLGLPAQGPFSLAFGQDARIALVHGKTQYGFADPYGSSSAYYRARFFNSVTRVASEWSASFQSSSPAGLPSSDLCLGYVLLVDMAGSPLLNQEVLIHRESAGLLAGAGGMLVAGGDLKLLTDGNGRAEQLLVRGTSITVAIGGTNIVRDIVVPTDPTVTSFNMLATPAKNDVFTVQVPAPTYAVRRTL